MKMFEYMAAGGAILSSNLPWIGEVLRDGVLYPRWAPDFYYGYGYPIFNYYAPFTYAFANLFDLIPGVDVVLSVKIVIVLAYALGAYGVYFLARRHFGSAAGAESAGMTRRSLMMFVYGSAVLRAAWRTPGNS